MATNEELDTKSMRMVANLISVNWKKLANYLFENEQSLNIEMEVENLDQMHKTLYDKCFGLLNLWKMRAENPTRHNLIHILKAAGADFNAIVRKLEATGGRGTSSGTKRASTSSSANEETPNKRPKRQEKSKNSVPGETQNEPQEIFLDDSSLSSESDSNTNKRLKVLFLMDEWSSTKGGISSANQILASTLAAKGVEVLCTVTTPKPHVKQEDQADAETKRIHLVYPKSASADSSQNIDWLNKYPLQYFLHLRTDHPGITHIVAHAPTTAPAAMLMLEDCHHFFEFKPKLVLFNHTIPEDVEYGKDTSHKMEDKEKQMLEYAEKADIVVSFGPRIFDHFATQYLALERKPEHICYLPNRPPFDHINRDHTNIPTNPVILVFGRCSETTQRLKGFDIAASAVQLVHSRIKYVNPCKKLSWKIRGIQEKDRKEAEEYVKRKMKDYPDLVPKVYGYGSRKEIEMDLKQSTVVLMPSRTEPFGLTGYEAMFSGTPTLITSNSGLAEMIQGSQYINYIHSDSVLVDTAPGADGKQVDQEAEKWAHKIMEIIQDPLRAFTKANDLKKVLMTESDPKNKEGKITKSQNEYITYFTRSLD